ncbi:hypothetical protein Misp05_39680 [Micromonospora sp. NBRC 107095]|nr:hypothetical protein Misp05_39680 [Micromonospora sp. NBRC 107095]
MRAQLTLGQLGRTLRGGLRLIASDKQGRGSPSVHNSGRASTVVDDIYRSAEYRLL